MDMNGEQRIAQSRDAVWQALNDPDVLCRCIPGCQSLTRAGVSTFDAVVAAKVGPVKARFSGTVQLSDFDPPNGYTLTGEGKGGTAGFAKGQAQVTLRDDGDETILSYRAQADVGGKLAQVGARLIDGAAKKMANEFFANLGDILTLESAEAPALAPDTRGAEAAPAGGPVLSPWVWASGLIAAVIVLLVVFGV